jgi:hypothetical protein
MDSHRQRSIWAIISGRISIAIAILNAVGCMFLALILANYVANPEMAFVVTGLVAIAITMLAPIGIVCGFASRRLLKQSDATNTPLQRAAKVSLYFLCMVLIAAVPLALYYIGASGLLHGS